MSTFKEFEVFKFPSGEPHVRVKKLEYDFHTIYWRWQGSDSLVELLLLADAIRRSGQKLPPLVIGYLPFGRQDRVAVEGDSLSLAVFAEILNLAQFPLVTIVDPHSDVAAALIKNSFVLTQGEIWEPFLSKQEEYVLVAPDAGARKKSNSLSTDKQIGFVQCIKYRNLTTGFLTTVDVYSRGSIKDSRCIIVDDICDGGATFINIAEALRENGAAHITLCVTHGLFTKGIDALVGIDAIYHYDIEKEIICARS